MEKQEMVKVTVLQLKDGEENHLKRFASLDLLNDGANSVDANDYKKVYETDKEYCDINDKYEVCNLLENLFEEYNIGSKPEGYEGHSLSVSDVILLSYKGNDKAFYCDSFGFAILPDQFVTQFKECKLYNLAAKLVEFAKNTDFYDYQDNLEFGETEEENINKMRESLNDTKSCEGIISYLTDYIAEEDIDVHEAKASGNFHNKAEKIALQIISEHQSLCDELCNYLNELKSVNINELDKEVRDEPDIDV